MPVNSNVTTPNYQTLEYQKFVQIYNDTRFPPITSVRSDYYSGTQIEIYDKYAVLTFDIGQNAALGPANTLPFGDNAASDAFGRLRVSLPSTLFNSKQNNDSNSLLYSTATVNTGSWYFDNNNACTVLSVSATGDVAIKQSKKYMNYQPGKSQLIFETFVMPNTAGIVNRVGLFDSSTTSPYSNNIEGYYFQCNNGVNSFHIANVGDEPSQSALQSEWNIDKLNGTGLSGLTLDVTKTQILVIDYEWLGVGRVRMGFCINGIIFYCHQFVHANEVSLPYLQDPNKPIRYEIRSTGGIGSLKQICASVMSEGGSVDNAIPLSIDTGFDSIGNISSNTLWPAITVRLKDSFKSVDIQLKDFAAMAFSTTNTLVRVVSNGVISNSAAFVDMSSGALEYSIGTTSTTLTGGVILFSSFFNKASNTISQLGESLYSLGSNINGTKDTLSLVLVPCGGNEKYFAAMNFKQYL
jgi:hypothetical protein